MNVAYLGWCPTKTAYTAYSIVHIAQTDKGQGHFSVWPQRGRGSSWPPHPVHATAATCLKNIVLIRDMEATTH